MRNQLLHSLGVLAAIAALSGVAFAQTYGTKGYAPGTWKPDELPPVVSQAKPFNAHDFSGV